MLTSCLEKVKCARCFEETLHLKKLGGGSFISSGPRRARTKNGYDQKMWRIELLKNVSVKQTFPRRGLGIHKTILTSCVEKLNCAFYFTCNATTKLGCHRSTPLPLCSPESVVFFWGGGCLLANQKSQGRPVPMCKFDFRYDFKERPHMQKIPSA